MITAADRAAMYAADAELEGIPLTALELHESDRRDKTLFRVKQHKRSEGYTTRYYRAHRERMLASNRAWEEKNREYRREYQRNRARANMYRWQQQGERLRATGIHPKEIAKALGVHLQTAYKWRQGHEHPSAENIAKLEAAFPQTRGIWKKK